MPNYTSNVNFMGPGSDSADLMEIERRKAYAQALQEQSMQAIPQQQGVPIHPFQGLAKIMQAQTAAAQQNRAQELAKRLGATQQERRGADMSALIQALQGRPAAPGGLSEDASGNVTPTDPMAAQTPAQGLQQALPLMQDPQMQQMGLQAFLAQQPKRQEPYTLAPGAVRYGPDGQPIAAAPHKPEGGFSLPSGGARFDSQGKQVASVPVKPEPPAKVPAGYRLLPDGTMEAIKGGPADLKIQGQFNQDTAALGSMQSDMDRLATEANRLKEHPGLSKATGVMGWVPGVGGLATIPGTDAANFKAGLETLKSQVAFGVLQNMRNNSKTGGALGQVSDKEGALLAANLAAIDIAQSPQEFKEALDRIIKYTDGAKDRLRSAFNLKHGDKELQRRSTDKISPQEQSELEILRKRFGR